MKSVSCILLGLFLFSSLYAQDLISSYDPKATLTPDQCYDVVKNLWDGLKKVSDSYGIQAGVKSEFESTAEFNSRIRREKEEFAAKVNQFSENNKLSGRNFSVWMKADLVKYDADNQVYSIKSPTQILVQPKKNDIAVTCPENKYVTVAEKNHKGYRSAYIQLKTEPEFSWYVNTVTAQAAKQKEYNMYFKLSFTLSVSVNDSDNQIVLQLHPNKLALMDQAENFIYWSEDIR
ncbi:MAG: hypothetical protein WCT99_03855 [Bacteroidota bacterium]|jgi:hypothetical protein